ncbi:MAG TPA: thioredoxin [Myxococcaceae bacterium]|jgi:thioredoxin 1|nr:thioredoxin [Myxococcaceae bacterium]
MAEQDVIHVSDGSFKAQVLESTEPVLVDFWATWCAPCKAIAPALDALAAEYRGKVKVAKLNIDEHTQTPQDYGIRSIPTLLLFKGGKVVEQVVGAVPKAKLEATLKKALSS